MKIRRSRTKGTKGEDQTVGNEDTVKIQITEGKEIARLQRTIGIDEWIEMVMVEGLKKEKIVMLGKGERGTRAETVILTTGGGGDLVQGRGQGRDPGGKVMEAMIVGSLDIVTGEKKRRRKKITRDMGKVNVDAHVLLIELDTDTVALIALLPLVNTTTIATDRGLPLAIVRRSVVALSQTKTLNLSILLLFLNATLLHPLTTLVNLTSTPSTAPTLDISPPRTKLPYQTISKIASPRLQSTPPIILLLILPATPIIHLLLPLL